MRQRVPITLRLLETSNESTQDITQPQYNLPPTNGRTNGKANATLEQYCRRRIPGVMDTTPRVASMAASMASRVCGT